jgi:hypothetical protein
MVYVQKKQDQGFTGGFKWKTMRTHWTNDTTMMMRWGKGDRGENQSFYDLRDKIQRRDGIHKTLNPPSHGAWALSKAGENHREIHSHGSVVSRTGTF